MLPLSQYTVSYEVNEQFTWLKFGPPPTPPADILNQLWSGGCHLEKYRRAWRVPEALWPKIKALLATAKLVEVAQGSINVPGRWEQDAAKEALQRKIGPGRTPDEELVQECAARIRADRCRAMLKRGHVRAKEVAAAAVDAVIALRRAEGRAKVVPRTGPALTVGKEAKANEIESISTEAACTLAQFDWSNFPEWAEQNLLVQDKGSGRFIPFTLNPIQKKFIAFIWEQWKRTGRVRVNVLKSRQVGISTACQGLFYFLAHSVPGVEALVVAHRADSSDAIFRRTAGFHANCKAKQPAELCRSNRHEIQYKSPWSSALRVATADDSDMGRGETRRLVHCSELGFWGDNGDLILVSLLNSVPDDAGSMVIKESTANGVTGVFYQGYDDAEKGRGQYLNFFVGVLEDPTAVWLNAPPEDDVVAWRGIPAEWKADHERLRALGATWDQLAWRLNAIAEKCVGSPEKFTQDYPADAGSAFLSSGANYFPLSIVDPELKRTSEVELMTPAKRYGLDAEKRRYVPDANGHLRVWKLPEAGHPYVVSGDVGRGIAVSGDVADSQSLDYTVFYVVDRWTLEVVAAWRTRMDPDLAAYEMAAIGRMYDGGDGPALLIPEANHYGVILVSRLLKEIGYTRVYRREAIDKATRDPVDQDPTNSFLRYGHWTGPGSGIGKAVQLAYLHEMVRDRRLKVHDPTFWMECRSYIRKPDGSSGAESRKHDDAVLAMSIACVVIHHHPKIQPVTVEKAKAPFLSLKWAQDRAAASRAKAQGVARGGDYA